MFTDLEFTSAWFHRTPDLKFADWLMCCYIILYENVCGLCMYVPGFGDNLVLKSKLTSFKPNSLWLQLKKKYIYNLA